MNNVYIWVHTLYIQMDLWWLASHGAELSAPPKWLYRKQNIKRIWLGIVWSTEYTGGGKQLFASNLLRV